MTAEPIRVFLLDDHELVRRGVAALLESDPRIRVVGEGATIGQARGRIAALAPDVALLDVRLPDGDGIELCRELRETRPELGCIMLTAFDDEDAFAAAVIAGASGYVLKDIRSTSLVEGVVRVAAGHSLLDPSLVKALGRRVERAPALDPRFGALSLRERQVLALISEGYTNRQIGESLGLAEKTIKNNVSSVLAKLGLHSRTQAGLLVARSTPNSIG
jgi:two-component system, NarL family, response regulator DevR